MRFTLPFVIIIAKIYFSLALTTKSISITTEGNISLMLKSENNLIW